MARHDITDWIIHFVHRRNSDVDPLEFSINPDTGQYVPFPDSFTYEGKPLFLTNQYQEEEYGLESDAYAITILKKILHDGYIRAGWSFRNGNATIYGPKAATCFTEMPLYGLIDYAKKRNDEGMTEQYGIAFLKNELYNAGARPVIYGLSTTHKEAGILDKNYGLGFRALSSECGLGLTEMYRYVYTKFGSYKKIDWMHEREWRWADIHENFDFPGMPVFADNPIIHFSQIIILVKTKEEAEDMIEHLKNLYHSGGTNYDLRYNLNLISNAFVLAIEELQKITKDISLIKLDDLPLSSIPKIKHIKATEETKEKVKLALKKASEISLVKSKEYFDKYGDKDVCGHCNVVTWYSNTEVTQALIDLKLARSFSDGYYHIFNLETYPVQSLGVAEAGMTAAAEYLTKELGQGFRIYSTWD